MTNFGKIRAMSIDEMAEWLEKQHDQDRNDWDGFGCWNCVNYGTHHDCGDCEWLGGVRQWLSKEAK